MSLRDLPPPGDVPSGALGWLKAFLDTLRGWKQARDPLDASVGDPYQKFTTRQELVDAKLLRRTEGGKWVAGVTATGVLIPGPVGPPGPPAPGSTPDLTPPPTPGAFTLTAGITYLFFELPVPAYTEGHGHSHTNIYGAVWAQGDPAPTFGDPRVKLIDTAVGFPTVWAYATQPATRWCCWIKWVTKDGVESVNPSGGINGQQATTGQDVAALLEVLKGQIRLSQLYADLVAPIASIGRNQDALASDALALALGLRKTRITTGALIEEARSTLEAADRSLAVVLNRIQAAVDNPSSLNNPTYAGLQQTASALATLDGRAAAAWTVRMTLSSGGRTVAGGFGLMGDTNNSPGAEIEFGIAANRFWVTAPSTDAGITDVKPFVIQTTPVTVNGFTIQPGVYMDAAFITNVTALIARLGTAWIDDAKIANLSAAKLTAGDGTIGGQLKSANWVAGVSGWRWTPAGDFEANNGVLRGTIFAGAGTIGGLTIGASDLRSNNYVPGTSGTRITFDGSAEFYNVTMRGTINATGGTIGGLFIGAKHIASTNFDGAVDGNGNITNVGTTGFALTSSGQQVVDPFHFRGQKTAAATEWYTIYSGAATATAVQQVNYVTGFVSAGYVAMTGVSGFYSLYINTSDALFAEVWTRLEAVRPSDGAQAVGPWVKQSVKLTEGRPWVSPSSYLYLVPISISWLFSGGYYVSRSYPPGSSGIPLPPVFVSNALTAGTWNIRLNCQIEVLDTSNAQRAALIEARLDCSGWIFENRGSQPQVGGNSGIA